MARPKVNFKEKVQKDMPEFVNEVNSLSSEQLDARLAQLAKDSEEVHEAQQNDEELSNARENASLLNAPYKDSKKAIRMKSRYIIELLKEKGK